jgi:hypothetical protein
MPTGKCRVETRPTSVGTAPVGRHSCRREYRHGDADTGNVGLKPDLQAGSSSCDVAHRRRGRRWWQHRGIGASVPCSPAVGADAPASTQSTPARPSRCAGVQPERRHSTSTSMRAVGNVDADAVAVLHQCDRHRRSPLPAKRGRSTGRTCRRRSARRSAARRLCPGPWTSGSWSGTAFPACPGHRAGPRSGSITTSPACTSVVQDVFTAASWLSQTWADPRTPDRCHPRRRSSPRSRSRAMLP